jgi:hypothetical protein
MDILELRNNQNCSASYTSKVPRVSRKKERNGIKINEDNKLRKSQ